MSEAAYRLDYFIMKWMGFSHNGLKGDFRKLTLTEAIAGLEENRAIAKGLFDEDKDKNMAEHIWRSGRFNMMLYLLKSVLATDAFRELERELHTDMVEFITHIDKPSGAS